MSAGSTARAGAQLAERKMIDRCRVRRPVSTTTDPLTGQDVTVYGDAPVYAGKCEVRATNAIEPRPADSASSQVTVQVTVLKVPAGAAALLPGDLVEFDDDTTTPRLRKLVASVSGVHVGTYTTAQRVPIVMLPGVVTS